jgi:hypothetical protein
MLINSYNGTNNTDEKEEKEQNFSYRNLSKIELISQLIVFQKFEIQTFLLILTWGGTTYSVTNVNLTFSSLLIGR